MKLQANARKGRLKPWDRHDHGDATPDLERVHGHFRKRGCDFGSSQKGEITVRNAKGRHTVYISRRSDGRWRVGYLPAGESHFDDWGEMAKELCRWGF